MNTERTRICEHRVRPAHSNNKMKLQIDECMDHRHLSEHSMKNAISVSTTAPSQLRLLDVGMSNNNDKHIDIIYLSFKTRACERGAAGDGGGTETK